MDQEALEDSPDAGASWEGWQLRQRHRAGEGWQVLATWAGDSMLVPGTVDMPWGRRERAGGNMARRA